MTASKRDNLTKKEISQNISNKLGLPFTFAEKLLNDTFELLTKILKEKDIVKIKNFGTFKKSNKKKRIGRNPKTKKIYEINARKIISYRPSIKLKNKINK